MSFEMGWWTWYESLFPKYSKTRALVPQGVFIYNSILSSSFRVRLMLNRT